MSTLRRPASSIIAQAPGTLGRQSSWLTGPVCAAPKVIMRGIQPPLQLDAWRGELRAGRKVVHRRLAPGTAHDEALVSPGSHIVADGAIASHTAGIRHEHARLARDVGAEIPGMG